MTQYSFFIFCIIYFQIDFEKSNSKKLEKDLRRTLAALEEERASAARHKQVALLLLKERKHVLLKSSAQQKILHQVKIAFPFCDFS